MVPEQPKQELREPGPESAEPEFAPRDEYRDGRKQWDWVSKYPPAARRGINIEASVLLVALFVLLICSAFALSISDQTWTFNIRDNSPGERDGVTATIVLRFFAIYFVGNVGGV